MRDIHQLVSRQVRRWNVEKKVRQESKESEKPETAGKEAEIKPVLTLSRQRGCRGAELARLIAHDLNYGLLDKEIVNYISEHMGVRSEFIESLDEQDRSELELWIKGMLSNQIIDRDDYNHALAEIIKTASLQGSVVILGRGANYLLEDTPAYRIRLVAPEQQRIQTLCHTEGMSEQEAQEEVKRSDEERANFIERYFQADINNPCDYDLLLNVGTNTMDGVVKIVRSALLSCGWSVYETGGDKRNRKTYPES